MSTIELPDDVAAALAAEAAKRGVTADERAAETLIAEFGPRRRSLIARDWTRVSELISTC